MKLLQNGTVLGTIVSIDREPGAPGASPDRLTQSPTHGDVFDLTLQPSAHFQFSKDAQYVIAHEGKPDQSITILAWSSNAIKYRHN